MSSGYLLSGAIRFADDIMWLEDQAVNGKKVLVPVVYLAKADGRLESN